MPSTTLWDPKRDVTLFARPRQHAYIRQRWKLVCSFECWSTCMNQVMQVSNVLAFLLNFADGRSGQAGALCVSWAVGCPVLGLGLLCLISRRSTFPGGLGCLWPRSFSASEYSIRDGVRLHQLIQRTWQQWPPQQQGAAHSPLVECRTVPTFSRWQWTYWLCQILLPGHKQPEGNRYLALA